MNYNELATYFVNASVRFRQVFNYWLQPTEQTVIVPYIFESAGLLIPLQGKSTVQLNGVPYCVEPGTILHVAKGTKLIGENLTKDAAQLACILFHHDETHSASQEHFKLEVANPTILNQIIEQLKHYDEQPLMVAALKCQATFYVLLEKIIEGMRKSSEIDSCLDEILTYIHQHYKESLSVTEIANCFDIERRHLAYIFKRHTGMSPLNYLTEYRIGIAKELLRQQHYPIMKVAELVGFEDNLYFSRIFKKRTGYSPTAYRDSFSPALVNDEQSRL